MDLKFADIPNGLAAIGKVPVAGWAQILAYMAFCEISRSRSRALRRMMATSAGR